MVCSKYQCCVSNTEMLHYLEVNIASKEDGSSGEGPGPMINSALASFLGSASDLFIDKVRDGGIRPCPMQW